LLLNIPIGGAFDAETYGISCQAFSNAAVSIPGLQSQVTNLNAQMAALVSGQTVTAPNPEILQAQGIVFGVALTAACAIYGLKRVYGLFKSDPSEA